MLVELLLQTTLVDRIEVQMGERERLQLKINGHLICVFVVNSDLFVCIFTLSRATNKSYGAPSLRRRLAASV